MFLRQPLTQNNIAPTHPVWRMAEKPADLAISLDAVKVHLKLPIEDTFWDEELTRIVKVATSSLEQYLVMSLSETTWVGTMPAFAPQIRIPKRPFASVTKIEYVDPDTGVITTVDPTLYYAAPIDQYCGMVFLAEGAAWPTPARRIDAVRITATSSPDAFPDGELPEDVNHALLMTIANLDSKRGDDKEQGGSDITVYAMKAAKGGGVVPPEARSLVSQLRLVEMWVA